ncbi:rcc01693 family protein [Stappia sp.]|uniref:rcc01693 family protein n=1 Tax=Stappia sp. TaxID=1870903 RepID=UPI003A9A504B
MIHHCLGVLRWAPETLWRATPREVALAVSPVAGAGPLDRHALAGLMRRFPDQNHGTTTI